MCTFGDLGTKALKSQVFMQFNFPYISQQMCVFASEVRLSVADQIWLWERACLSSGFILPTSKKLLNDMDFHLVSSSRCWQV